MAVDQNLVLELRSSIENDLVHQLYNFDASFMCWCSQVLPVCVIVLDLMLHQKFWGVAEPCFGNDTITTVRMLTWLLKIEDSSDAFLFELLYHCMFENQSVAQSLGANEETNHPL